MFAQAEAALSLPAMPDSEIVVLLEAIDCCRALYNINAVTFCLAVFVVIPFIRDLTV